MSQEEITPPVTNTNTNDTPADPAPPQQQPQQKKYLSREITWVGRTDGSNACGGCQDLNNFFTNELVPQSDVPTNVKKLDVDSPEGKQIVQDNNLKYIPYAKECLISSDPNKEPECKEVNRWDKNDWKIKVNDEQQPTA